MSCDGGICVYRDTIIIDTSGLATHNYSRLYIRVVYFALSNLSSSTSTSPVETRASVKVDESSLSMTLTLFRVAIIIRFVYKLTPLNICNYIYIYKLKRL